MNEKLINVFFDSNGLPYKDTERQVHFPITGSAFLGASNTTKIRFYFDQIGNSNTTWVAVAKLPNGKQGSKVLSISEDTELGENYAELELDNWFTQAKGDVYIALQGYQGGVEYSYDSETELYEITGTPTIQTTGSIKLAINYAPIGQVADYNDEFTTYQEILAALGDKADISNTIIVVNDITQVVATTYEDGQIFYNLADRKLYQLDNSSFVVFQPYVVISSEPIPESDFAIILAHKEYPIIYSGYVYWYYGEDTSTLRYVRNDLNVSSNTFTTSKQQIIIFKNTREYDVYTENAETYNKSKIDTELSGKADKSTTYTKTETDNFLSGKQNTLVSGTNIKSLTVDGVEKSLLGSGTIEVGTGSGGGAWGEITGDIQDQTDLQNEFQDIREVAEGKCKTYILSYSFSFDTRSEVVYAIENNIYSFYDFEGNLLTVGAFTNLIDGTYNDTCSNSSFNSQNNSIMLSGSLKHWLLLNREGNSLIVLTDDDIQSNVNKGDIFLITETDVPDRWFDGINSFYKLETTKIDLTNYATTGDLSMARYETELMLAPEYNAFTTYAVGDKVVRSHKLYTCNTPITTPESWDSTHWTQVSVASGFVDLDKAQTISGSKTFTSTQTWGENASQTYLGQIVPTSSGFEIRTNVQRMLALAGYSVSMYVNLNTSGLLPRVDNSYDIGSSTYRYKDLYLSGALKDGNNTSYGLTLPDTTNFTANKEIATTDYFGFKIIPAPSSTTLTDDEIAQIIQGVKVSGSFQSYSNSIYLPAGESATTYYGWGLNTDGTFAWYINKSTKVISKYGNTQPIINLQAIGSLNGKSIPSYPSNTGTFVLKCVDGVLTWVAE